MKFFNLFDPLPASLSSEPRRLINEILPHYPVWSIFTTIEWKRNWLMIWDEFGALDHDYRGTYCYKQNFYLYDIHSNKRWAKYCGSTFGPIIVFFKSREDALYIRMLMD